MNENQITTYMLGDEYISKYFVQVVSYDELPNKSEIPVLYVVNTDTSEGFGKHWVCVFIQEDMIEYFDSLGKEPKELYKFLRNQNIPFKYSLKQIQQNYSDVCGDYCILYSYFRSRGYGIEWFLDLFDNQRLTENDILVEI